MQFKRNKFCLKCALGGQFVNVSCNCSHTRHCKVGNILGNIDLSVTLYNDLLDIVCLENLIFGMFSIIFLKISTQLFYSTCID